MKDKILKYKGNSVQITREKVVKRSHQNIYVMGKEEKEKFNRYEIETRTSFGKLDVFLQNFEELVDILKIKNPGEGSQLLFEELGVDNFNFVQRNSSNDFGLKLAKEIEQIFLKEIKLKGGAMHVIDIYIKYNHLRKVDSITPKDLLDALSHLNQDDSCPLQLH